ncbi:hypothetical protein B6N60_04065 [Richelia sinica FACHB-800]|uniref:Uncharacterized protein n=1 Tax=Richelia sinica FACHB-800 TaxID=1357546 RepID=A0A975Y6J6_9NOST|nr:hypothetical protein [Richelia sinica]QXE25351.1 hypothetical protein B6N60_04065 [Richelia sinica FACHB-800]
MSQDKQREPRKRQQAQPTPKPYQRNQPIWKVTIIQILRGTIGVLETAVDKLETETPGDGGETVGFVQRILLGWDRFLRTFRLFLPSSVSNSLSDATLTGILAIIAVVVVWTGTNLFSGKPVEVATVPPVEERPTPAPTMTAPPESEKLEPKPAVEEKPTPEPTPTPEIEEKPIPEPTPTPEVEEKPIPEPTPTPEVEEKLKPETQPKVELTPEQVLIAGIKNRLAEISDRFATGLIESIQANFRTSDLTVMVSDNWYSLEAKQQNQLAADVLGRSQELYFTHLEIVDTQNKLVARSPVVGNEMVIFKRRQLVDAQVKNQASSPQNARVQQQSH